jgi:uncharacterized membrane protein
MWRKTKRLLQHPTGAVCMMRAHFHRRSLSMPKKKKLTIRIIVSLALLAALSIVLTRVLAVTAGPYRFSIGNMPIVLAGILFGPLAGALTGFVSDFIGASLTYGWSPQLMVSHPS